MSIPKIIDLAPDESGAFSVDGEERRAARGAERFERAKRDPGYYIREPFDWRRSWERTYWNGPGPSYHNITYFSRTRPNGTHEHIAASELLLNCTRDWRDAVLKEFEENPHPGGMPQNCPRCNPEVAAKIESAARPAHVGPSATEQEIKRVSQTDPAAEKVDPDRGL